jgi:hypothetical protein
MEINVEKTKTMRISRQPTPLQIKIDKKTGVKSGRVQLFVAVTDSVAGPSELSYILVSHPLKRVLC